MKFTWSLVDILSVIGCFLKALIACPRLVPHRPMFATRSRIPRCSSSRLPFHIPARHPRFGIGIRAAMRSNSSSSSSTSTSSAASSLKTPNPLPLLVLFATLGGLAGVLIASALSPTRASKLVGRPSFSYKYASSSEGQKAIEELKGLFPDKGRVATERETLETYGYSPNSYHHAAPHSVVVRVFSTEDVVKVVNVARKWRMPIIAYSGGTSLEGHFGGVGIRLMDGMMSYILYSTITKVLLVAFV